MIDPRSASPWIRAAICVVLAAAANTCLAQGSGQGPGGQSSTARDRNVVGIWKAVVPSKPMSGEFDGFELHIAAQLGEHICGFNDGRPFLWSRMPHMAAISTAPTWKLSLDLITSANQRRGSLVLYRHYDRPDLQLDFNLLTSEFPKVLAEAIERASVAVLQPVSAPSEVQPFAASL